MAACAVATPDVKDLLDLHWDEPQGPSATAQAAAEAAPTAPVLAAAVSLDPFAPAAPAAPAAATEATAAPAPAAATAAGDDFDFDDFGTFQSAAPVAIAAATAPAVAVAPAVPAASPVALDPFAPPDRSAAIPVAVAAVPAAPAAAPAQAAAGDLLGGGLAPASAAPPASPATTFDPLASPKKTGADEFGVFQSQPPAQPSDDLIQTSDASGTDFDPISSQTFQAAPVAQATPATAASQALPTAVAAAIPTAVASGIPAASLPAAAAVPVSEATAAPAPAPAPKPAASSGENLLLDFDPAAAVVPVAEATAAPAPAPAPKPTASSGGNLLLDFEGATPAEPVQEEELYNADGKKVIYVYHKGERNILGWYSDASKSDIKEAILCACDSIMDHFFVGRQGESGFVLREVQFSGEGEDQVAEPKEDGRVFDFEQFHELRNEGTYIMEEAKEREDLKSITGDRWRRLKVQVEPLLHVEATRAIERMRRGSNLLKHTHYGFPHLRQFQLSDDRKRLVWYSGAKRKQDSVVNLEDVQEIQLGQTTPVFLHYRLPMLEHLSFSLIYGRNGSKSLDLTCKDEFEFDNWVTGLKAVFYHHKNRLISKEQLLGHSKRFRKALEKNNVGIKLTKLPEVKEKGHVGLDDCIEIVTHTPQQLDTKMERLRERLRTMSQQVARLDHHSTAETELDLSLLSGQGPAYANVFVQDEDAQDQEMEIRRMHELVEQTTQLLQQARNELVAIDQRQKSEEGGADGSQGAKGKKKENAACKHVDQLLWKAEVDLENVEDMYLRHIDNQGATTTPFAITVADMSSKITRSVSDGMEEMRGWFR